MGEKLHAIQVPVLFDRHTLLGIEDSVMNYMNHRMYFSDSHLFSCAKLIATLNFAMYFNSIHGIAPYMDCVTHK